MPLQHTFKLEKISNAIYKDGSSNRIQGLDINDKSSQIDFVYDNIKIEPFVG